MATNNTVRATVGEITKPFLVTLRAELDAALQAVAEKHGVSIRAGNASFDALHANFKVEVKVLQTASGVSGDEAEFRRYAGMVGLQPDVYGKTFVSNGSTFTVSGLSLKSRRMPVLARREDGKVYKFPVNIVCLKLGVATSYAEVR